MKTYFFLIFSIFFAPIFGMELSDSVDYSTNQDGDSRGIFSEAQIKEIQEKYKSTENGIIKNTTKKHACPKPGSNDDSDDNRLQNTFFEKKYAGQSNEYQNYTPDEMSRDFLDSTTERKSWTWPALNSNNLFAFGLFATFICLIGYKILSENKKLPSPDSFRKLFNISKTR